MVDRLLVNVASSTDMIDGFVNLDNHVLLHFLALPRFCRRLLSPSHRRLLEVYEDAIRSHAFIRCNCKRPLPFADGSVDHILCSHFLEHVFPSEADSILMDFKRALKPAGTLHIVLPDLLGMAKTYIETAGPEKPYAADEFVRSTLLSAPTSGSLRYRILEFTGAYGLAHRWMYDRHSISSKLNAHGFELLDSNETPSAMFRKDDGSVHVVAVRP